MYGGQASLGRACADLFQQARLNTDCKINFPGWVGVGLHISDLICILPDTDTVGYRESDCRVI